MASGGCGGSDEARRYCHGVGPVLARVKRKRERMVAVFYCLILEERETSWVRFDEDDYGVGMLLN